MKKLIIIAAIYGTLFCTDAFAGKPYLTYICSKHGIEYIAISGTYVEGFSVSYDKLGRIAECKP